MNNTIEVLEDYVDLINKYIENCKNPQVWVLGANDIKYGTKLKKALTKAIATLKAVESAGDELPKKRDCPRYGATYDSELETKVNTFNEALELFEPILAKQILKNKEAQSITAHEIEGTTEYKCEHKGTLDGDCVWCALSVAETGLDKQRAKVKELEAELKIERSKTSIPNKRVPNCTRLINTLLERYRNYLEGLNWIELKRLINEGD